MRTWVVASVVALGTAGCGLTGDPEPVSGQPAGPTVRPSAPIRDVGTVAEAIASLEDAIQGLYLQQGITADAGIQLLERARSSADAYERGELGEAFTHIQQAHTSIEDGLARGHISTEDVALRLHRSVDLIGAVIASNPPRR